MSALCCLASSLSALQGCNETAAPVVSAPTFALADEFEADALHCLTVGDATPPIEALTDAELSAMTRLLGGVMATYRTADFGLFLAMRRHDRGVVPEAERTAELHGLLDELGAETAPTTWVDLLGEFWARYYDVPPVRRFVPEATRARLGRAALTPAEIEPWLRDFDALAEGRPFITHRLAFPHRHTLLGAEAETALVWIDYELAFESDRGYAGRLWLRFVWDDEDRDWFLHRALSALDGGEDPAPKFRNLIL
jgi:hypothetical protein